MSRLNFARLLGAQPKAVDPKATDDEDKDEAAPAAETDSEDPDAKKTGAEDGSDDDEAPAAEGGEDDEESPAARAAFRRGVRAERARWSEIMAMAEPHTAALACQLAADGVSPKAAKRALAVAPKAAVSPLAAAMRGRDPKPAAPAAKRGEGLLTARMQRLIKKEG